MFQEKEGADMCWILLEERVWSMKGKEQGCMRNWARVVSRWQRAECLGDEE